MTKLFEVLSFGDELDGGVLRAYNLCDAPFPVQRVFSVATRQQMSRGAHAHKRCNQFIICTLGKVRVLLDNGQQKIEYVLSSGDAGVLVPAGIWSKQTYLDIGTSILVLCDRVYEVEDYIHDYKDYIAYVTNSGATQKL